MTPTKQPQKQQPPKNGKVNTQKYPFYPKVNVGKWQSEVTTKKEQRELND